MEEQIFFKNNSGQKLAGLLGKTNKGTDGLILVMAHGFTSSKRANHFEALVPLLQKQGISTFRFDFSGHGESEGLFKDITITQGRDDILAAIEYVKSVGYSNIALLGSSFGGCTSILAAENNPDLVALILKSPVSDYLAVEKFIHGEQELERWKKQGYIEEKRPDKTLRLNYSFVEDFSNHDFYASAKNIHVPVLLLHGTADMEVPFEQSEKLATCIPDLRFIKLEGCDHRYTKEKDAEKLYTETLSFLRTFA